MQPYVPMMMRPGWVLERYYGWGVLEEGPCVKLFEKRRGPVRTFLLLALGASEEEVPDVARRCGLLGPFSIAVINDFSSASRVATREIAGASFRRVEEGRWFGVGTFVFDLTEGLGALWARVAARERTKCRKAESLGARVEFSEAPSRGQIDAFLALYLRMARGRGLERPERVIIERMARQGDLLMSRCVDSKGRVLVVNLTYLQGGQAYFLHGVRGEDVADGAGHLTQWKTIERLKAMGLGFYDLGLVASRDASDGIYRFKRSLGGSFVDFGEEFQRVPRGLQAAYRTFRGLRGTLRKLG